MSEPMPDTEAHDTAQQATADTPPIDVGSEWSDTDGPPFTVRRIWIDGDGITQVQIREHGGRTLSITSEDIYRRVLAGEVQPLRS